MSPEQQYYAASGRFNISCYATGEPRPKVEWYKDGRLIQPNNRFYITYKCELLTEKEL